MIRHLLLLGCFLSCRSALALEIVANDEKLPEILRKIEQQGVHVELATSGFEQLRLSAEIHDKPVAAALQSLFRGRSFALQQVGPDNYKLFMFGRADDPVPIPTTQDELLPALVQRREFVDSRSLPGIGNYDVVLSYTGPDGAAELVAVPTEVFDARYEEFVRTNGDGVAELVREPPPDADRPDYIEVLLESGNEIELIRQPANPPAQTYTERVVLDPDGVPELIRSIQDPASAAPADTEQVVQQPNGEIEVRR